MNTPGSFIRRTHRTIVITGTSGNLGSAVIHLFLTKGYRVVATVTNEEAKKALVQHENLWVDVVDLSNESETVAFVRNTIEANKKVDAALLLVGGFAMGNIADTKIEDIRKQITLNFETAYNAAKPLFVHMLENNNGRIVFIGARPSLQPGDGKDLVAYALSKALLFKLAEYMNEEGRDKNVTATVVVPSTLDTAANRKNMPDADPKSWVSLEAVAEILEFVVTEKGAPLRETVLKVYNNA